MEVGADSSRIKLSPVPTGIGIAIAAVCSMSAAVGVPAVYSAACSCYSPSRPSFVIVAQVRV